VPRIVPALDDLLHKRGDDDLKEGGRGAVLELMDRVDARRWLDWFVKTKGPVDALVVGLWGRCRKQASYRRALPEARSWRDAIEDREIGSAGYVISKIQGETVTPRPMAYPAHPG